MRSHVPADFANPDAVRFLDKIEVEGKNARDRIGGKWNKDAEIYRGSYDTIKPPPEFHADLLNPAIRRKVALIGESSPIFDVLPRRPKLDATAAILKIAALAVLDGGDFAATREAFLTMDALFGAAGIRTQWDRMGAWGMGEITVTECDPRNILLDPAVARAKDIHKGQYVRIESLVPLGKIRQMYPQTSRELVPTVGLSPNEPGDKDGPNVWNLRRIFRGPGDQPADAVPRIRLREYYLFDPSTEDGAPLYPNGRYIARANDDTILNPEREDSQNPYFDGLPDLDVMDNQFDPDHPWGRSEIEALRFLERAFNKLGNLATRAALRNGYPWITAPRNALDTDTIQRLRDLDQMVLEYQPGGEPPTRVPGIPMTQDMVTMQQFILQLANQNEGLVDPGMEGKGRVELRSGAQLEGLQQAAQILVRAEARRFESLIERVGTKIISRIFQFYTDDRMLAYYGGGETFARYQFERNKLVGEIISLGVKRALKGQDPDEPMDDTELANEILLEIKGAWKLFNFRIVPYSSLAGTKVQRAQVKGQLAEQGLIPTSMVVREAGFDNPDELLVEAAAEMQTKVKLGLMPPPGEGPPKKGGGKKK